ncbi:MAG: 4a-hydroxytetrahydrobiopterin dehydratase [Candidatus Woesearchaeota archaeon]
MALEPLDLEEILDYLSKLNGWDEFNQDFISKSFHFVDFKEALEFVNKISVICEAQNHHPKIILSYGCVVVELSTHDVDGLTIKDFELARLFDEVFENVK